MMTSTTSTGEFVVQISSIQLPPRAHIPRECATTGRASLTVVPDPPQMNEITHRGGRAAQLNAEPQRSSNSSGGEQNPLLMSTTSASDVPQRLSSMLSTCQAEKMRWVADMPQARHHFLGPYSRSSSYLLHQLPNKLHLQKMSESMKNSERIVRRVCTILS